MEKTWVGKVTVIAWKDKKEFIRRIGKESDSKSQELAYYINKQHPCNNTREHGQKRKKTGRGCRYQINL